MSAARVIARLSQAIAALALAAFPMVFERLPIFDENFVTVADSFVIAGVILAVLCFIIAADALRLAGRLVVFFSKRSLVTLHLMARGKPGALIIFHGATLALCLALGLFAQSLLSVIGVSAKQIANRDALARQTLIAKAEALEVRTGPREATPVYQEILRRYPNHVNNKYVERKIAETTDAFSEAEALYTAGKEFHLQGLRLLAAEFYIGSLAYWPKYALALNSLEEIATELDGRRDDIIAAETFCGAGDYASADEETRRRLAGVSGLLFYHPPSARMIVENDDGALEQFCWKLAYHRVNERVFRNQEQAFTHAVPGNVTGEDFARLAAIQAAMLGRTHIGGAK